MPRDVSTRWNLTYDMLSFAVPYCAAIDMITGDRAMKMRQFELSNTKWKILTELRDSLKVLLFISNLSYQMFYLIIV